MRIRCRRRRAAEEEKVQAEDDVGHIDRTVGVAIGCGRANRLVRAREESEKGEDGVGDVHFAINIGVANEVTSEHRAFVVG